MQASTLASQWCWMGTLTWSTHSPLTPITTASQLRSALREISQWPIREDSGSREASRTWSLYQQSRSMPMTTSLISTRSIETATSRKKLERWDSTRTTRSPTAISNARSWMRRWTWSRSTTSPKRARHGSFPSSMPTKWSVIRGSPSKFSNWCNRQNIAPQGSCSYCACPTAAGSSTSTRSAPSRSANVTRRISESASSATSITGLTFPSHRSGGLRFKFTL